MIKITRHITLNESELHFRYTRSKGPGGQNVNKVSSAVQLRFNILQSLSLPESIKNCLYKKLEKKISHEGDYIIKANQYRTQERNKTDAINRLVALIQQASKIPKNRKATKPTKASKERRLAEKKSHGKIKSLRRRSFIDV